MNTINCIAIDDNISALEIIEGLIKHIEDFQLVSKFSDPIEAGKYLKNNKDIDLIFLDIDMPGMTGLTFLRTYKPTQLVIFISKHKEMAVDSYEIENDLKIQVIDFLPIPVKIDRFIRACSNASEKLFEKNTFVFLNDNHTKYKVAFEDIIYIESDEDDPKYVIFSTRKPIKPEKRNPPFRTSLNDLEYVLPSNKFMRVNKSCILNVDFLHQIKGDEIIIAESNNKSITVGDKFKDKLKQFIKRRTGN